MTKKIILLQRSIMVAILFLLMSLGLSNVSRLAAAELVGTNILQQGIKITGKVTDTNGVSLPGVTILLKETTNNAITDANGNYSLSNISENTTLVFSFIGMKRQEVAVGNNTTINVTMEEQTADLDQVLIVGYGTVKKSDLTGSIATVAAKDMKNASMLSADQALQGRATGVLVVNNSGAPGSPVSIKIRGIGSFGNTDPLYVVDGMPIKDATFGKDDNPSGINYLNPNDIESIQVLKDASAAAIYGTRGANGVILITTKRGKNRKMKVDIDNYMGVQSLYRNVDVLDAQQFSTLYKEIRADNLDFSEELQTTDWVDRITDQAIVYNNQISISGGNNTINSYLSLNNYNQQGIVKGSGYERQSVRLNVDNKVNSWLKTGISLTIMQSDRLRQTEGSGGVIGQALKSDPTVAPYDSTGNWSELRRTGGNPLGQVERNNYSYSTKRLQGSLFAEIEFFKNLKYKINTGLDRSTAKKTDFQPAYFISGPESSVNNTLYEGNYSWDNWLIENILSYNITKGNHKIDALVGYTTQYERKESYEMGAFLPSSDPDMRYFSNVKVITDVTRLNGDALEWSLISQLGRFNYAYGEESKYLFTASVRRDGSSRFGDSNKYGVFPSWSAAWKISSEKFFTQSAFFSNFDLVKLRFGWGKVGNQNIVAYSYLGSVSNKPDNGRDALQTYMGLPKTIVPVYVDKTLSNTNVGWETSVSKNLGLDISMLRNSLSMTFDIYDKLTSGLLMQKPLPMYFSMIDESFGYAYTNLGSLSNKGFEFALTYKKYEGNFHYEISGNLSKNFNKVISLDGGQPPVAGNSSIIKENVALGTYYGFKHEGIFQSQDEIDNHAYQTAKTAPGDFKFKDINKDGKIDGSDMTFIGNAFPSFNYGFTLNMSYRGFDLNIFSQGVSGNLIYNQLRQSILNDFTVNSNVSPEMMNYWGRTLADGSIVTNTDIPRLGNIQNNNARFSDYYLENGSYFRIKAITLGYTLKKEWTESIRLSSLRIYMTLQNPITFTKYSGFDPEIGQSNGWNSTALDFGTDGGAYPQAKMVMGGLSLSF